MKQIPCYPMHEKLFWELFVPVVRRHSTLRVQHRRARKTTSSDLPLPKTDIIRVILFLPFLAVTVSAPPRFPRDTPANMSRGHGHIFSPSIWHSFLSSSSPSRFSCGVSECVSTARLHVGPVRRCTLFNVCALAILLGLWTGPLPRRRDGSLGPGTNALVDVGPSALVYSHYCSPLRSVCVALLSSTRRHGLANWRALLSQNRSLARLWDGRIAYDVPLLTLWCFAAGVY